MATGDRQLTTHLVGREAELQQLHEWLEKALNGERQIVFITGEPGIGKTTLVEAFLQSLASENHGVPLHGVQTLDPRRQTLDASLWIGRGQCIEHYGSGEAYMPVLEALGRLSREPGGERLIELLGQYAPTWLVQMPSLLSAAELEALQRKTAGATRERMLRELVETVEALTGVRAVREPSLLVLVLEDLQWSDYSTLEWLSALARRRERVRLLVLGTYRPVDVIVREHPLKAVKQELQLHGQCTELPLACLTEVAVTEYLAKRFSVGATYVSPLRRLARTIHQRTDGNPLFMVNVVDYLVARGVLVQSDGWRELQGRGEEVADRVPESLQQMIEQQIEQLSPAERQMLEVASVAGAEFSAAALAAGMETEIDVIEDQCEELVRREHFLQASGTAEWPDGTVAARYSFLHALYQDVLYNRLTARRRQRLHQRIGERQEQGYGERAKEIAAELAVHFERGRDYRRAIQYLHHAAKNAVRRSAYQEAISLLTKGLDLLQTLPDTPARAQQELTLQLALGGALMAIKGYAVPEVGKAYVRARELGRQVGKPPLSSMLGGLATFYITRGDLRTGRELAEQLLHLAQSLQTPARLQAAHHGLGEVLFHLGELPQARTHLEQALTLYDPQQRRSRAVQDFGVACLSIAALTLWSLGYPDQALQRSRESLTLAQELAHPFSLAFALYCAARLYQLRREVEATQEQAEALLTLSHAQGFTLREASGVTLRGWVLVEQGQGEEGLGQIRQGLAAVQATGADLFRPYYLALLAEAYGKAGQGEQGLAVLAEALAMVDKTGERWYEAELYRLYGELSLRIGEPETGRTGDGENRRQKNPRRFSDSPLPRFFSREILPQGH